VAFDPVDFVARLAALIPKPRVNLTRYHGVLAPNHHWRSWVTHSRSRSSAAAHFSVSLGIQFVLNALIFSALLAWGLSTWPAQLLTTLLLTFVNYAMYRLWVFA
jgi:hypothetical protein